MKFTKKEVLEAIMKEPLAANLWIVGKSDRGYAIPGPDAKSAFKRPLRKNCQVCLVGGLLRMKAVRTKGATLKSVFEAIQAYFMFGQDIVDRGGVYTCGELSADQPLVASQARAKELIEKDLHLAALSNLFETYTSIYGISPKMRKKLATVVRKLFPKEFEADVRLAG